MIIIDKAMPDAGTKSFYAVRSGIGEKPIVCFEMARGMPDKNILQAALWALGEVGK